MEDGSLHAEGPSFSRPLKLLASAAMLALANAGWTLVRQGHWQQMDRSSQLVLSAGMLVMAAAYAGILVGRTSIDGVRLRQTGLWSKDVLLADITQVKLIDMRGLSWLIAPRLVVCRGGLSMTTFHIGDAKVRAACRRLVFG